MKKAMIDYMQKPKFDDIYTPAYAIKPLLKYIPKGITIWECCDYGKSEITRLLKEHGCNVISTDKEENFFEYKPKEHFDMIITNPPYSLKDEFIKKCYDWNKPFCLLLPITALEGKNRGVCLDKMALKLWYSMVEFNLWKTWLKIIIKRKVVIGLIQVGFVIKYCLNNLYLKD